MKIYRVNGNFRMGQQWQHFKKEVLASSKVQATDFIYSRFGSRHKTLRKNIKIEGIEEIKKEDIEDPIIAFKMKNSLQ